MIRTVLISGAGIAGPSLAFWLARRGCRVTVVERATALRKGGQAVDFRGSVQLGVLDTMGVVEALRARSSHMRSIRFADTRGRTLFHLPASFWSGDLEVPRGDLVEVFHARTKDDVEYVFGDSITAITQDARGVDVTFEHGAPRRFDIVVGADGQHSCVRSLAFGPESQFVTHRGYAIAVFHAQNFLGLNHEGLVVSDLGRAVSAASTQRADECMAMLVHTGHAVRDEHTLRSRFAGMGRDAESLVDQLGPDFYASDVARIDVDRFARGRVVLLGDAATGATIGGQGTGVAVVGAYVLAGELARSEHPEPAFARYEATIASWARGFQDKANVGQFFAPTSRSALAMRNLTLRAFTSRPLVGLFEKLSTAPSSDVQIPDYS